jgi:hypothetical protein
MTARHESRGSTHGIWTFLSGIVFGAGLGAFVAAEVIYLIHLSG